MNTSTLIAAAFVALTAAGTAAAQEAQYELPQTLSSATTRAAVLAELRSTNPAQRLIINEAFVGVQTPFVATQSRDTVRAQAEAARFSGEWARYNGEGLSAPMAAPARAVTLIAGK